MDPFEDDLPPRRSVRIGVRITPDDRTAWEAAAIEAGVSLSRYVRGMVKAARSNFGHGSR